MKVILLAFVLALGNAFAADNSITKLVDKLSRDPMWQNGESPIMALSETAKPEEVIKESFKLWGFDRGHVSDYKVKELRQVKIKGSLPDDYFAALCETNLGDKIVLFQYVSPKTGWWTRMCEVP